MPELSGRKILLGITGGIAAYKSVELARLLIKGGADVRVVMTPAATQFVGVATFQAVTMNPVLVELFDEQHEAAMGHIELARWADLILVAPASADFIARAAHGLANDLLSTVLLATTSQVAMVPAMNQQMWRHPATVKNSAKLLQYGMSLWGPARGEQACGDTGVGRMLEATEIYQHVGDAFLGDKLFSNVRVLLTAGPTQEALDPVRFIGNRSSGKMGYAIAEALIAVGATVTIISGPVNLKAPDAADVIQIKSAKQMYDEVMKHIAFQDIFIACAAVADYRPETISLEKIKKGNNSLQLKLVQNPDIIKAVTALTNPPFTLGFAAETTELTKHAQEKLLSKNLDMIAANLIGVAGQGIEADSNALSVLWQGGSIELPLQDKKQLARQLVTLLHKIYFKNEIPESEMLT